MTLKFVRAEEKLVSVFAFNGHLKQDNFNYLLHFHFLLLTWTHAPLHGCFPKISTEIFLYRYKKLGQLIGDSLSSLTLSLFFTHHTRYHINRHVGKSAQRLMGYLALSSPRIYRLVTRVLSGKLISHKKNRPLVCAFVNLFIYVFFFFTKSWFALNTIHQLIEKLDMKPVSIKRGLRAKDCSLVSNFTAHRSVKSWSLLHTLAENCLWFPANGYHMCTVELALKLMLLHSLRQ